MNTSTFLAAVVTIAVVPALVSVGCNKKEDEAPVPSAVAPAPPPPPVTPPPAATPEAPKPVVAVAKPGVKTDGGAKGDAAVVVGAAGDAGKLALPTIPTALPPGIAASSIPGVASAILNGAIGAIPPGLLPPPAGGDK